jgi:large subunit ribosomal protein L10
MAVTKQQKEEILKELIDNFSKSKSVVFAANTGLSVKEISDFRGKLRENGGKYQIAKKTLIKLAAQKNDLPEINDEAVEGPIGVIFSFEDELFPAQAAAKFAKENEKLEVKGGIFFGDIVNAEKVLALSKIPSREELLAKLVGCIQAPISGFVGVGKSVISGFVRACGEVVKQKEQAA